MASSPQQRRAEETDLPLSVVEPALVTYRSAGIGMFGVVMRFAGMPLEKVALFMNSSQVTGKHQFRQSLRLTFKEGLLAPYRVVGPASLVAWFLQYSIMGMAFQFFDHSLSKMMGVKPVAYGQELMQPPEHEKKPLDYQLKTVFKTLLAPIFAASLESNVSNRAEVQRFFGPQKFSVVQSRLGLNPIARFAGPAFLPNAMRNVIMCQTSFVLTPITYKLYFPQEQKSQSSLFWYGLSMNIFVGNVFAITQQALWGRTLDYAERNGRIHYRSIIQEGLAKEGLSAFFTLPKWSSRVLMNAPAQGTLPWFYNDVLPQGELFFLEAIKTIFYQRSFLATAEDHSHPVVRSSASATNDLYNKTAAEHLATSEVESQ